MNIKNFSGKKLIISFILILVVFTSAFLFVRGNRPEKNDTENFGSKANMEQTPQEEQKLQVEKCTFIEDSEPGWLPFTNPIPKASTSHKNGESIWEWKYRKSTEYNFSITLRDKRLSLQYEFPGYKSDEIDISDVDDKLSFGDGNIDVKLVAIDEYDYEIFAVFSFWKDNRTAFLKIQFTGDTFSKFIYPDDNINDITFVYSTETSDQNPVHDAILRCREGKYSIDIVSTNNSKSLLLPENIQNPIGFYHVDGENIYLEAKEGEYYAIYSVNFLNNTMRKITDTNKIDNILSIKEIFSSDSNSLNLFVVGEYKNTLALYGSDGRMGGHHEKESFSLIDKETYKKLLHIESNFEVPYIGYHIDSINGYCYILHDKYFKKYDMSTGNVIWEYEINDLTGFTVVDNVIYLTKDDNAEIIDSTTGKKVSKIDMVGYEEVIYSSAKTQKLFVIKDKLNTTVKLLDKNGKAVKELSGSVYYNNNEIILLESNLQKNEGRIFKYISFDNPNEEIEFELNSEENIQVLSREYLVITRKNGIKLFSVDERKYIWEKEIDDFRSAKKYKDHIYISGEQFICASVKDGKEKWRVDNYYNTPIDYMFSFGNKLFVSSDVSGSNRSYYRIYNIDTGEYLYHLSDFSAALPKVKGVHPFYQSSDKAYISKDGGGICIILE